MKDYLLVVLSSSPYLGFAYEQGLEIALNLADAQYPVKVLIDEDLEQCLMADTQAFDFAKKLKQLDLYEVDTYAQNRLCLDFVKIADANNLMRSAKNILVF